ncbi:hypothetical protein HPB50_023706 [Hyalomma asiaticum]|uniref:Uncharacterized protein n=1 Tax=Hyalomma asiaticum TaxID=266040 RepID=A0ACB7T2Z8_HYAAI|nr:hypothetical protein HPB50_023706 [Hyalomma asiaticum]
MEAVGRRVRSIAGIATVVSYFSSLSISWWVWHDGNPPVVMFLPLAANIIHLYAQLLNERGDDYDANSALVSALGLLLMGTNAAVYCTFSRVVGPGHVLVGTLYVMTTARLLGDKDTLRNVASVSAVICNVLPIVRILTVPLPLVAASTLTSCGLWVAYGVLAKKAKVIMNNTVGAVVAAVELGVPVWIWHYGFANLFAQSE